MTEGLTIGTNSHGTSAASWDGWELETFAHALDTYGYAVVEQSSYLRPWNHRMIGTGVGHNDARFSESGGAEGSMAAYYENGQTFDGSKWWDTDDFSSEGVRYYGCRPRTSELYKTAHSFGRHTFLAYKGLSHADCPLVGCTSKYADYAAEVMA